MTVAPNGPLIERRDEVGRPVSLTSRWPDKHAVLFTGAAGLGTTAELNRAAQAAHDAGALVLRTKATASEPLEHRFSRDVGRDLGGLRAVHGWWRTRRLKRTLRDIVRPLAETTPGGGWRTPSGPGNFLPQREFKEKDRVRLKPPATLNDLADAAAEIADRENKPAMIIIDDIHRATMRDLAAINELAEHLEQSGSRVILAMSGGENAPTLLHKASRGVDGRASDMNRLYDIRRCDPFSDEQLRPVLRHALAQVVPDHLVDSYCRPQFQEQLLLAANGNAGRLSEIVKAATERSNHGQFQIDGQVADWAVQAVDSGRRAAYEAAWNESSATEKMLMVQMAAAGDSGLDIATAVGRLPPGDLAAWAEFDTARQLLDGRGLIDVSWDESRLEFSSPGMRHWVTRHNPAPRMPAPQAGYTHVPPHLVPGAPQSGQALAGYRRQVGPGQARPDLHVVPPAQPDTHQEPVPWLRPGERPAGQPSSRHRGSEGGNGR